MLFETIALSVITVLLLLLMLTRKPGRVKLLLALRAAAASIASTVFFILMQRANPANAGQDLLQVYAPCAIYVLITLFSLVMAALSRRKLRQDKAAKAAVKAEKSAEKAAAKTDKKEQA